MLALGSSCLMLAVGAAVDISDLTKRKSTLQSATDAAVLAATVSGETKKKDLEAEAKAAFVSNFDFKEGESLEALTVKLLPQNELELKVRLKKPTVFGGIVGKNELYVNAEAATYLSSSQALDVALVLDRTGSMAGVNMAGLITAASGYISDLENSGRDVRVSVVPFSDYVNIGAGNINKAWLDLPSTGSGGSDVMCSMESVSLSSCPSTSSSSSSSTSSSCTVTSSSSSSGGTTTSTSTSSCSVTTSSSGTGTIVWSDVTTSSSGAFCSLNTDPQESSGNLVEECTPQIAGESWFGCVGSRAAPYNTQSAYDGQKIPLVYDRTCGQPLTELTSNLTSVAADISSLTASGSTYIPAGLQWGWRTLDSNAPFKDMGAGKRKKLLILMTDGQNTRSQIGSNHNGSDYLAADSLTQSLCTGIKDSGIDIATVSYSNNGSSSADSTMLSNCASSSTMYFNASNAIDLEKAFLDATNQGSEIRLIR